MQPKSVDQLIDYDTLFFFVRMILHEPHLKDNPCRPVHIPAPRAKLARDDGVVAGMESSKNLFQSRSTKHVLIIHGF